MRCSKTTEGAKNNKRRVQAAMSELYNSLSCGEEDAKAGRVKSSKEVFEGIDNLLKEKKTFRDKITPPRK